MRSFNSISWVYDRLTFVIFLGNIQRANNAFASRIDPGSHILIAGGGTGQLLPFIPKGTIVDFIDPSHRMVNRARYRRTAAEVRFHVMRFEDFKTSLTYDAILCPFYLDLYTPETLLPVLRRIKELSSPDGMLWVSDFTPKKNYTPVQSLVFQAMRLFYRVFMQLTITDVIPVDQLLKNNGWVEKETKTYYQGMIFSTIYKKQIPH